MPDKTYAPSPYWNFDVLPLSVCVCVCVCVGVL